MNLSTTLNIPKSDIRINPDSKLLTIGSCFSDHIGNKLGIHQFSTLVNPFGTVFNPISLAKLIDRTTKKNLVEPTEIDNYGDRNFHYDFHSLFDSSRPEFVVDRINESINKTSTFLDETDILILTFGTSIAYSKVSDNGIVSNCHKVPNKEFERLFISTKDMTLAVYKVLERLTSKRRNLRIITTVSPVRHTKEGLVDNLRSKSRLIEVCHVLSEKLDAVEYFPSYELMMDELRDYRFYNTDMIHPSPLAVDIIWERFINTYFSDEAKKKVQEMDKLNRAANHRPFDISSLAHKNFCLFQLKEIERLGEVYPEINFEKFIEIFK